MHEKQLKYMHFISFSRAFMYTNFKTNNNNSNNKNNSRWTKQQHSFDCVVHKLFEVCFVFLGFESHSPDCNTILWVVFFLLLRFTDTPYWFSLIEWMASWTAGHMLALATICPSCDTRSQLTWKCTVCSRRTLWECSPRPACDSHSGPISLMLGFMSQHHISFLAFRIDD